MCVVLFFFSSRRRHTRWPRDWSSDVCSSDLNGYIIEEQNDFTVTDKGEKYFHDFEINLDSLRKERRHFTRKCLDRSEERRVGKECRCRWEKYDGKKKMTVNSNCRE